MSIIKESLRCVSASKKIDNQVLNRLGIQCARTFIARAIHQVRSPHFPSSDHAQELRNNGLVLIHNFLPDENFEALKKEAFTLMDKSSPTSVHEHGRNTVEQFSILDQTRQHTPNLFEFIENSQLRSIVDAGERRKTNPLQGHRVVERLIQASGDEEDQESQLHSDTFFHNHKCWLYLDDVTEESGPLVYVPGSNRYSFKQARHQYVEANQTNQGSRRISEQELAESGLSEKVVVCSANTLVVADTAGYHRRMPGTPGHIRRAIQLSYRFNPFFPTWLDSSKWLTRQNPLISKFV